jgi:hypothetical protein
MGLEKHPTMADNAKLERIALELYGCVPAEFTALRNARAKAAAAGGDRSFAAAVRALPRPSASAWAVNRLHAKETTLLADFSSLGSQLRAAQKRADRVDLDRLVGERRSLVARAIEAARREAKEAHVGLSATAVVEIEQTLQAALADAAGAEAAFSGRLVRSIRSDGLEPVDLDGAIAGAPVRRSASHQPGAVRGAAAARDARASAALERAQKAADVADAALAHLGEKRFALEADRSRLADDILALQEQYDRLERRRTELDEQAAALERESRSARDAARAAHVNADRAAEKR